MTARRLAWLAVAVVVVAAVPRPGEATPSFARRYELACAACHTATYPELSAAGRRFKERGYKLAGDAEEAARVRSQVAPGGDDSRLALVRELPLAVRVQMSAVMPTLTAPSDQDSSLDLRFPGRAELIIGGALQRHVSAMLVVGLDSAAIEQATVGFHYLVLGEPISVRAGKLAPLDFVRPARLRVTRLASPTAAVAVGLNPTVLDAPQPGIDVYGRAAGDRLFYRAAVLSGATRDGGVSDLDSYKDGLGELQLTVLGRHVVGALAYVGRTQITDEVAGVAVRFTDSFWIAGGFADVALGPASLFAMVTHGRHGDPYGIGSGAHYWGVRADAAIDLAADWRLVGRWDQVIAPDVPDIEISAMTVQVSWHLVDNARLALETYAVLSAIERGSLALTLDLAF